MTMTIKDVLADCDLRPSTAHNFSPIPAFDLAPGKPRSCARGDKGYSRRPDKERVLSEAEPSALFEICGDRCSCRTPSPSSCALLEEGGFHQPSPCANAET